MRIIPLLILISLIVCNASNGQKSYIVHIEKGQSLRSSIVSKNRNSNNTIVRQLCSEPMNLWEVKSDRLSERSIIDDFSDHSKILLVKENKTITLRAIPNDSLYNRQWQYNNTGANSQGGKIGADINAEAAWDVTTGGITVNGDEIVVAVVDDGLDIFHPDIIPNLWINKLEIPDDGIDNDENGYIDDVNGWNASEENSIVNAGGGHGTPVAGIVGAKGNNNIGVTGVNWNVKLMPIDYGVANEANAIASYAYAYKMRKLYNETNGAKGAFVVATNSSWGVDRGKPEDASLWCAFYDSLGKVGILSVGATANLNVDVDIEGDLPTACNSEYLLTVTNLNKTDTKETNAGYGKKSIDLGAYGASTYTIAINNRYNSFGGTSGATPHVAGAVALMYSVQCLELGSLIKASPSKAALVVKDVILSTTKPNPSIETTTTTGGKLDLGKAITTFNNQCGTCKSPAGIEIFASAKSAKVEWLMTSAKISLRIRKEGDTIWTYFDTLTSNNITIDSIDFCTNYEFQLKYECNEKESDWGYRKYFITKGCCTAPKAIDYFINDNQLTLKNSNQDKFIFEIKSIFAQVWDSIVYNTDTTLLNLSECSSYDIRLSTFCPIQDKFSPVSNTVSINTSCGICTESRYCPPKALSNTIEWIDSVQIGDKIYYSGNDESAYGNHLGTIIPNAKQGDSIFLKIVPGYSSSKFNEDFTAHVDWNQNQNFDQNEQVFATDTSRSESVSGYIKIPIDASIGYTRMRIIMAYKSKSPACGGTALFGEVEDYCFLVEKLVGVKETISQLIQIYPNPNDGYFTLQWDISERPKNYQIVNILGKTIDYGSLDDNTSGKLFLAKQLQAGHYNIILNTDKASHTKSFIVR